MNKLRMESKDMVDENIKKIGELFPNCITETKDAQGKLKRSIKWDVLKEALSGEYVEGGERYEFMWPGKKAAFAEAMRPIRKTLRPCKEESKNWDSTENLYIEGDNLEVLKLLQESYLGKVKMIYIDPPYNTGNDFVYRDNFTRSQDEENEQMGLFDEDDNHLFKNTDTNGRFHSDWCSMIYSRLMLARNLLAEDGVVFISIDDNEVENLRKICDEVFGTGNFLANFLWKKKGTTSNVEGAEVSSLTDATLCYKKSNQAHVRPRVKSKETRLYPYHDAEGDYRMTVIEKKDAGGYKRDSMKFEIIGHSPRVGKRWQIGIDKAKMLEEKKRFVFDGEKIQLKIYSFEDRDTTSAWPNLLEDCGSSDSASQMVNQSILGAVGIFDTPKPIELLYRLMAMIVEKDSIVLDFFSGSATTAHAVMQLNAEDGGRRKFIMVQLPEKCDEKSEAFKAGYKNICEIGKERIRRAGEKIVAELKAKRSTTDNADAAQAPTQIGTDGKENPCSSVSREAGISAISGKTLPDIGFRVLKVADSNMKDVYYAAGDYTQDLLTQTESNIKEDRTDLDLLFGCVLDWGLPLSLPYKSEKIDGCTVHTYNDGDLIACFDANIPESVIKEIAKRKPLRAVFRDSGFASSPEKINVFEIFKLYAPDTSVKVI